MKDDEYVERATKFRWSEAPGGKRLDGSESFQNFHKRLSVWNSLDWNGKWKRRRRETRKNAVAIVDAVAGQLELTDYQTSETQTRFADLPPKYNKAYSTALLAVCIGALTAREDGRDYHPNQAHPNSDTQNEFTEVVDDIGVSYSALYSCWKALRREIR